MIDIEHTDREASGPRTWPDTLAHMTAPTTLPSRSALFAARLAAACPARA